MLYRFLRSENMSGPAGVSFVALGLILVGFALVIRRVASRYGLFGTDGIDFAQGLCFGVAFAFEVAGISALVSARKNSKV